MTAVAALAGVVRPIGRDLAHGSGGLAGAIFVALATLWAPLMIIDAKRCTRETNLRAQVEADLERHNYLTRVNELELARVRTDVEGALSVGGPCLVFQPIVEMTTGAIVGYEALSRFSDEQPPDQWFDSAARVGLGVDLELLVVRAALTALPRLPATAYLSINVSPATLINERLYEAISRTTPDRVVVELTEHVPLDDYEHYRAAMLQLRMIGVRLAIDDAGSGYSSFRHIVDLKPDIIKIDGSLIHGVHLDPSRRSLMIAFVSFANDLGATLVAECVETYEEAEVLRRWGVQQGQGWHFGRPQRLEVVLAARPRAVRAIER
jgi:EAL domain-containing protein (putative c-di-GMP-specific phosphodiesterase class I)